MTRPPAPALSDAEAATVARFDAAPVPDEVVVIHTVADAMHAAVCDCRTGATSIDRQMAAAAIAAMPPSPAEEAVERVEALADELQWLVDDETVDETARVAHAWTLHRLRAALASPTPAPQAEEGR